MTTRTQADPTVTPPVAGLTADEVAARRRVGEVNATRRATSRTYTSILRRNVFSFYNAILFAVGALLLALGRYNDAVISVGTGLLNALLGAVQEIRAKRKLDSLQLLDDQAVPVVRDGVVTRIGAAGVVRGDVLLIRPGGQIVVDGPVVDGRVEVDESLLTGESDPLVRDEGEPLRSGSFCVAGEAWQRADAVGAASYAGRLTLDARRATTDRTPLQRRMAYVVRLTMALVVLMSGIILVQAVLEGLSLTRTVQITAVLSGLVPYGLFLLIGIAYVGGAASISRRGALVQQVNAVESVTHVDVVCTDKTGTLTTGRLTLAEVAAVDGDAGAAEQVLTRFAAAVGVPNLTAAALAAALPGAPWPVRDEVVFASSLRWSGQETDGHGTWVLGAPEALAGRLTASLPAGAVRDRADRGLRVLLLARAADPLDGLRDPQGRPALPRLVPVALVVLADELRAEVTGTVARFRAEGVAVKVISGDDPRTVAALAARAGLEPGTPVSGAELDGLGDAELDRLVARTTVFGRVAPEQKEQVVAALRRGGAYVAMLGDGVNDARALKAAQVGVAMRSGSAVTRDVADIVLVDDSFAALLPARTAGRRIVAGLSVSTYVFMSRVATQGLVILAVTMLGLGFPYSPTQVGLTLLTVGVPSFVLTAWAGPDEPDEHLLANLGRFVVPTALVTAGLGTAVYAVLYNRVFSGFDTGQPPAEVIAKFQEYTGLTYGTDTDFTEASATVAAQTGLSTFVCLASFVLLLFLRPPHRFFAAWTRPVADRRPALLVAALVVVLAGVLFTPVLSSYFGLTDAAEPVFEVVLPALVVWFALMWAALRLRLLDRVLRLDDLPRRACDPR